MDTIAEASLELSQCYDMKNNLSCIKESLSAHSIYLTSLLDTLGNRHLVVRNTQGLNEQLNSVVQRSFRLHS